MTVTQHGQLSAVATQCVLVDGDCGALLSWLFVLHDFAHETTTVMEACLNPHSELLTP